MGFDGSVDVLSPQAHTLKSHHSLDRMAPDRRNNHPYDLPRAASFTDLTSPPSAIQIKRTFSENTLVDHTQQSIKVSTSIQNANTEMFRRASKKAKKRMSMSGFVKEFDTKNNDVTKQPGDEGDQQSRPSRNLSGTLKSFARRSWMPNTRSISPVRKEETPIEKARNTSPTKKYPSFSAKPIALPKPVARVPSRTLLQPNETGTDDAKPIQRRTSPSPARNTRSLKDLSSKNSSFTSLTSLHRLSRRSSSTSIKSKSSADGMYLDVPGGKIPPMPTSTSSDHLSGTSTDSGKKKDPLWGAFRTIEGEYATFQAKTSLQKAKTIRTILLPFLSKHAAHTSSYSLRAEDLDRRIHILNKWWSGLLDLLNGRSNQSLSGTDRPAFLEATTEIMLRPEWRIPPFAKLWSDAGRGRPNGPSVKWTFSVDSDDSDFLLDSIYQNIRNVFVQNLLSQMAFVVDKLSMRNAPASLVNFSGKTCAYAFFFCPGVADVLVRLWHLPIGILRRVFSEYGALHTGKGLSTPLELATKFPPPIRSLCFTSQSALSRHLQPKAVRPPGSENIRWYGPWVNRWVGRDSDLFFVFVKYYHILVCEFHPAPLTVEERVCIPGLMPVHAQLLVALESSLYRHVGHFAQDPYTSGDTLEVVAPVPITVPNATRSVAENRLVMLLRDMVGDLNPAHRGVSELFVGSFDLLLKAATRKISMFNHDACFVLCDFLDEVCPILGRYQQLQTQPDVLDWDFWLKVLRQMMQAHTTMIQIRVIALLYSMWNSMAYSDQRKRALVLDWILEPAFFGQFFNHWSAMVRHYFFRLLCWRVARCDGEASELDMEILHTLFDRLNHCWAHHQYLVAEADMRDLSPPSSNPCSPAPGRTLVIVRTDSQPLPTQFSTFDQILSQNQSTPYRTHSTPLSVIPDADQPQATNKKRWSLLRNINPFGSGPGNSKPGEVTPPASPDEHIHGKKLGGSRPGSRPSSRPTTPPHQALAFKFSLEYATNRPTLPQKSKKLPVPILPTNAQKLVNDLTMMERLSSDTQLSSDVKPLKPKPEELVYARYSGRALAEWALIVAECRNFYTRRKQEGCPKDILVETPTMVVESFRMFG